MNKISKELESVRHMFQKTSEETRYFFHKHESGGFFDTETTQLDVLLDLAAQVLEEAQVRLEKSEKENHE